MLQTNQLLTQLIHIHSVEFRLSSEKNKQKFKYNFKYIDILLRFLLMLGILRLKNLNIYNVQSI